MKIRQWEGREADPAVAQVPSLTSADGGCRGQDAHRRPWKGGMGRQGRCYLVRRHSDIGVLTARPTRRPSQPPHSHRLAPNRARQVTVGRWGLSWVVAVPEHRRNQRDRGDAVASSATVVAVAADGHERQNLVSGLGMNGGVAGAAISSEIDQRGCEGQR